MKVVALTDHQLKDNLAKLNFDDEVVWHIEDEKLSKHFEFKNFQSAFGFMTMCALYCDKVDNHPEWKNCYNRVYVQLITHSVKGISTKDFDLANHMDKVFKHFKI